MAVEVSQPGTLGPGEALITVTGAGKLDPAGVSFAVEQPARGYLQRVPGTATPKEAFGTTQTWLRPLRAQAVPGGVELLLGPDQTWHLKPNITYLLRLRDAAHPDGAPGRMAWKPIRLPSQPPKIGEEQESEVATKEEEKEEEKKVVDPPPPPPPPPPRPPRSRAWLWLVLVLLALLAGGGAWYAFRDRTPPLDKQAKEQNTPHPSPQPLTIATARSYLQTAKDGPQTYDEAQQYVKAGTPEALQGALILLTHAADAGSGPAETAIGRMYDPDTFRAETSAMKAPDPDKALLWYHRAADANDPEGLYRYGKLLLSGRGSDSGPGPEQGVAALQKAAALGSADAKAELDKLQPAAGGKAANQ